MILYRYASTDPIFFKITLNGVGKEDLSLAATDVQFSRAGAAWENCSAFGQVTQCACKGGWYKWVPSGNTIMAGAEVILINIKDTTQSGALFNENAFQYFLGGDDLGRLNGV